LTGIEQQEVRAWLSASESRRPDILRRMTTRASVAKVAEYVAYYADPAIVAWRAAMYEADVAQRILTRADALINNEASTAISADNTGTGGAVPPSNQPPGGNTP
jgi:hypothetical protein